MFSLVFTCVLFLAITIVIWYVIIKKEGFGVLGHRQAILMVAPAIIFMLNVILILKELGFNI